MDVLVRVIMEANNFYLLPQIKKIIHFVPANGALIMLIFLSIIDVIEFFFLPSHFTLTKLMQYFTFL